MKEQLISFKTAKLARVKECKIKLYNEKDWEYISSNGDLMLCNYNPTKNHPNANRVIYCTQSLLQRWLRDIHNTHVFLNYCYRRKGYLYILHNEEFGKYYKSTPSFNTYEEALEMGLQEALKLIK